MGFVKINSVLSIDNKSYEIDSDPEKNQAIRDFRARFPHVGILCPDEDWIETKRWFNLYMYNSLNNKNIADNKLIFLYGINNVELYNRLLSKHNAEYKDVKYRRLCTYTPDVDKSSQVKKLVSECTYLANDRTAISNQNLKNIYSSKQLEPEVYPYIEHITFDKLYYTPQEMEAIYNEDSSDIENFKCIEWLNEYYKACYSGIVSEEFLKLDRTRRDILNKVLYENKDYKLMNRLGWNPICNINESYRSRIVSMLPKGKIYDVSSLIESVNDDIVMNEANRDNGVLKPVFLVFTRRDTLLNTVINKVTKGKWAHVAIGFEYNLKTLYTYSMSVGEKGGFFVEGINSYIESGVEEINVLSTFVNTEVYKKMKDKVKQFDKLKDNTYYSYNKFISVLLKVKDDSQLGMICSSFVDTILKSGNVSPSKNDSSILHPNAIYKSAMQKQDRFYKIFKGAPEKYNPIKVKNYIESMMKRYIESIKISESADEEELATSNIEKEIKELYDDMVAPYLGTEILHEKDFFIEFDDDENLLIGNNDMNLESEYKKSHKLLDKYKQVNNIDAIKFEVCKLWYMNTLLEQRIEKNKDKKDIQLRTKVLSDYHYYTNIILKHDKKFNFQKYYDRSKYGDSRTKISKNTVRYLGSTIKSLI